MEFDTSWSVYMWNINSDTVLSRMCRHCLQPMFTLTTTCWVAKICTSLKNMFQKGKPRCSSQKL
jgi:hypothetical protein